MIAFDTNVLIYINDSRDIRKQMIADDVVKSVDNGILLWQVAVEYLAASRKLSALGFDVEQAITAIRNYSIFWTVSYPNWDVFERATRLMQNRSVSIWDALIVAACLEAGVQTLYSEDINDDFRKEGLTIINPFK